MGSLGERLKQVREEAGLSLEDLSEKTKIQAKYLERLENEEFDKLPNPVYVKGFVQKWADVCGAEKEELLLQLHRENKILFHAPQAYKLRSHVSSPFVITSRHLALAAVLLTAGLLGTYFFINHQEVSGNPQIEIMNPLELSSVSSQGTITIAGRTQNIVNLKINGELTPVSEEGQFEYSIDLAEGLNTIKIQADNGEGKEVEAVRKVLKL